jgi:Tol biopolymer transport system component
MFGKWEKPGVREPQHITSSGFFPTLSRDGKLLAYVSNLRDNVPHIWLKQTAGGEATYVTGGPDPDDAPEFSPDGTRIMFTSGRGGGGSEKAYCRKRFLPSARRSAKKSAGFSYSSTANSGLFTQILRIAQTC